MAGSFGWRKELVRHFLLEVHSDHFLGRLPDHKNSGA